MKLSKTLFATAVAILSMVGVQAQTFTPTSAESMTQDGVSVSFAKGNGNNDPFYGTNGLRLYASNTITVSGDSLRTIQLICAKQGTKAYATLTADCGTLTSATAPTDTAARPVDIWAGEATQVVFTLGTSGQRVIKQIVVNGDTTNAGGDTPVTPVTPTDRTSTALDSSYVYSEPTEVGIPSSATSAAAYEFVDHNILVSCSKGAVTADYFSCYAGATISFTATRPIKGLAADAYLKKEFSATTSAGTMETMDASEDTISGYPALIITDIDANTVTLTCVKQIRFYAIRFYFEANPDEELDGNTESGYSYDYEPTEVSQFTLTMDSLAATDMAESLGYKSVYLDLWNDSAELYVVAFADYDSITGIPVGTYAIDSTYAEGTIEASVGGDDYYDYESYLATNYETIDGTDYYDPYYIVSGTLTVTAKDMTLNATTYYGSTIVATYTFPTVSEQTGLENVEATQTIRSTKMLHQGRLLIEHKGTLYNAQGLNINR